MAITLHLIGVPFDSAGTVAGVARAPAALRAAGLLDALRGADLAVVDRGDVPLGTTTTSRDPESGLIAADALGAMIRAAGRVVGESLRGGAFPVVVGGDCPVLIGCLRAAAREDLPGLLFIDGHEDAWPPHASPTGEAADMELGFLLGRSSAGLPASLRRLIPRLEPERVSVVGPRDRAEILEAGVTSIDDLVDIVRTEDLAAAQTDRAVTDRVARLDALERWWLHVDLDVLSTDSLAAVDYRQPGGLDWPTLTTVTRRALAAKHVIGWDVTIYNPDLDPGHRGAEAIVRYMATALAARPGAP